MAWLKRFWFFIYRGLISPFLAAVRPQVFPAELAEYREQLQGKPVIYVIRQQSWSDSLVIRRLCKEHDLPLVNSADDLPAKGEARFLYLPLLRDAKGELGRKIDDAASREDYPLQLVPVSIFWGRDPGKETSVIKLLAGDSEKASGFRKMMIMLVQGRDVIVNFGEPLPLPEFSDRLQRQPRQTAQVLYRLFSFHFARLKTASLGPSLVSRTQMVNALMKRQVIQDAIAKEAKSIGKPEAKVRKQARKMAMEIAASFDLRIIRVFEIILGWVWQKIYSGLKIFHVEGIRDVAQSHNIIYMPSHRSHLDYLLISYVLFHKGLVPPHIAAGVNLNFWPIGGFLRRAGAFYMRRSFSGQKLYTAIFKNYLELILGRGYPIEFFPEGGRSRTGRLLPPRTGLLSMLVDAWLSQPGRRLALVPVYIGYDKLVESGSYVKELRGGVKKKESATGLLGARKIFKSSYGSPYVSFGEPIKLDEALTELHPGWRESWRAGNREWLPPAIHALAQKNAVRINEAVVLNPVGLVAVILLSAPQKAIGRTELYTQIDTILELMKIAPYSDRMVLPEQDTEQLFEIAASTAGLAQIDHSWGPIVTVSGNEAVMLTYYRNSIMHVLALPSLIARFFRHHEQVSREHLLAHCELLYPFLKRELFVATEQDELPQRINDLIEAFVTLGLISQEGEFLQRAAVGTSEYTALVGLGRVLRETVERYTMTSLVLIDERNEAQVTRKNVEKNLTEMSERLGLLSGHMAPEYSDKLLFRGYIDALLDLKYLRASEDESATLIVNEDLKQLTDHWVALLGPSVQQTMQQLIREPQGGQWQRSDS